MDRALPVVTVLLFAFSVALFTVLNIILPAMHAFTGALAAVSH